VSVDVDLGSVYAPSDERHCDHPARGCVLVGWGVVVMPGHQHGASIKNPRVYEALKREGMSKTRAAKISNAAVHKGGGGKQRRGKGRR
jgi:hypothetical protein